MAQNIQVHCINKSDRTNPHERIANIGGLNSDGTRWRMTEDAAIAGIKAGKWSFFVSAQGSTVWVIVATHLGREYLKTQADGLRPDNLLSLPECP